MPTADAQAPSAANPRDLVLRDVRALGHTGEFREPLDVVVIAGEIRAVERNARAPTGALEVDAAGLWLMPGVVDCHVHAGMSSVDTLENLRTPLSLRVLDTANNLRSMLVGGVTFARDAGGVDAGVREALERGLITGPGLQVSIVLLSQTGGHMDGYLAGPGIDLSVEYFMPDAPGRPPYLVDGEDSMRRAVRQVLRAGGDWIKVCTTGGVFEGSEAAATQLSVEEVRVAVEEAARRGKGVMAHALGGEGIDVALEAGVRSIEHGVHLTESQASRMAASGTVLVPTLAVYHMIADRVRAKPEAFPAHVRSVALDLDRELGTAVRIAHDHGVPIALGSDFATREDHGGALAEAALLHRAGLSVEAALLSATRVGAELCGIADRRGSIAPGFAFDALLLDEDPRDLSCFLDRGSVTGVFRDGVPVLEHPRVADAAGRPSAKGAAR